MSQESGVGGQGSGRGLPGELLPGDGPIAGNAGRETLELTVRNSGHWPIQVSSHYHFFEANRRLVFDRAAAFGMRLDLPAGDGLRIEPGSEVTVRLVPFGGQREAWGFNGLTNGKLDAAGKRRALRRARQRGFLAE
jgi:urease beta subunit